MIFYEKMCHQFPLVLTFDLDVDDPGGGVPLEVAGVAAVVPRLVPADSLEDETVPRNENSPADVLLHAPILNSQ